ncbi:MAG: hypothetical protein GX376_07210 [Firmicutes bacterium]|nr:hypothetical protein [Bacillota bacterium]
MAEGKVQILLEELYRLVETVAEGVGDNSRRLDLLTAEVGRVKEGQMRLELLVRRLDKRPLDQGARDFDSYFSCGPGGRRV